MRCEARWAGGLMILGRGGSNHWVIMDSSKKYVGGEGAASSPMELVLIALGGCTGMDVVSLLKKKGAELEDLRIEIEAERADEHPKVYQRIQMKYLVKGRVDEEDLRWAIEASQQKYCSVSAMLKETAELTHSWELIP